MEEFESILRIATNYGLAIVLCVILLWNLLRRDKYRDSVVESMGAEIKQIREEDRTQMMDAINGNKAAVSKFADAFSRFTVMLDEWRQTRACLWTEEQIRMARHRVEKEKENEDAS